MKKQVYIAQLVREDQPFNPREEFDNLGHMVCAHGNYNLGDEQSSAPYSFGGYEDPEDNFMIWVFAEFIEGSKNVPASLKDWYTTGCGAVFAKLNASGQEVSLEDNIPPTFKAAIQTWIDGNLCILPLYLYDH